MIINDLIYCQVNRKIDQHFLFVLRRGIEPPFADRKSAVLTT